jgi:hypothetical protein
MMQDMEKERRRRFVEGEIEKYMAGRLLNKESVSKMATTKRNSMPFQIAPTISKISTIMDQNST